MYRSGTAILPGEDRLIPNVLAIVMSQDSTSAAELRTHGSRRVLLRRTNYGAPCYYFTEDISHFDNTPIGNMTSSRCTRR